MGGRATGFVMRTFVLCLQTCWVWGYTTTSTGGIGYTYYQTGAPDGPWLNDWDGCLCGEYWHTRFLQSFESIHNNHREDRRFRWDTIYYNFKSHPDVEVTTKLNSYDRYFSYNPGNVMFRGFHSEHSNGAEDREWYVYYSKLPSNMYLAQTSYWIGPNDWDAEFMHLCPSGYSVSGIRSSHDNNKEDRKWEIRCGEPRCNSGYYVQPQLNECLRTCPSGYGLSGRTCSYICRAGSSSTSSETSCSSCATGKYQPDTGQSSCYPCPSGKFASSTGRTSCTSCPAGTFQPSTGQTSCLSCPSGEFASSTERTSCTSCPAGQFQPSTGQTSCLSCPDFMWAASPGQSSCNDDCPEGHFGPKCNDVSCLEDNYCSSPPGSDETCCDHSCDNTCEYAFDGDCDDGGPGADYGICGFGTDCSDCCSKDPEREECIEGASTCSNFYGNGLCTNCKFSKAGSICEHNICRESDLAKTDAIRGSYSETPGSFNWGSYNPDPVKVVQKSDGRDFFLEMVWHPSSIDILDYTPMKKGSGSGYVPVGNGRSEVQVQGCDVNGVPLPTDGYDLQTRLIRLEDRVGDVREFALQSNWKLEEEMKTGGNWGSLEDGLKKRETPFREVPHRVEFHSYVQFAVSDLYNTVAFRNLKIEYMVGGRSYSTLTRETGFDGLVAEDIVIEGMDDGETMTDLMVTAIIPQPGVDLDGANFQTCIGLPGTLLPGQSCHDVFLDPGLEPLNYSHTIEHLPQQILLVRIVDTQSVKVGGTIHFAMQQGGDPCYIEGVTVRAIKPAEYSNQLEIVLQEVQTNGDGAFEFPLPKNTNFRIEFDYYNHSFIAADGNEFLEGGMLDDDMLTARDVENLRFEDTTTSLFEIFTGVTACGYSIGEYRVDLKLQKCPDVEIQSPVCSRYQQTCAIELPAHAYTYDIVFDNIVGESPLDPDGNPDIKWQIGKDTLQNNFEFKVPERDFDITRHRHNVTYTYHPDPEITLQFARGALRNPTPSQISQECFEGDPEFGGLFDYVVESNTNLELVIKFKTRYDTNNCYTLPANTTVQIGSSLGVDEDPCDSSDDRGCTVEPETYVADDGIEESVARRLVACGNPYKGEGNSGTVEDFLGANEILLTVFNENHFADVDNLVGKSSELTTRVLVLGYLQLTADTVVTYFTDEQDHVPLLYLYAPPPGMGTSTVSIDLKVEIARSTVASTVSESGEKLLVGMKTEYESETCAGLGFLQCFAITSGEKEDLAGGTSAETKVISYEDTVRSEVSSEGLSFKTGEGGDMVMLEASVAKFITAQLITFNLETCRINVFDSTLWGDEHTSLAFFSRADVANEIVKHEKTARDSNFLLIQDAENPTLTDEERAEVQELKNTAVASERKWVNLLDHWDKDRKQSRNFPVDVRNIAETVSGSGGLALLGSDGVVNRYTFGASEATFSRTTSFTDSSVVDYTSSGDVSGFESSSNFALGVGLGGVTVGGSGSTEYQRSTTTSREERTDETYSNEITHVSNLKEENAGDTLCVAVYESPHSKGLVFDVCGGYTMCPHVSGTDPREIFDVRVGEAPPVLLQQDTGRIVLLVENYMQDVNLDALDLVIELDAQTAISPVSFNIGGSYLSQPFYRSFPRRAANEDPYEVVILFERLDPGLELVDFGLRVRSECDNSIFQTVSFTLRWASSCPGVSWGGDLQRPDGKFEISLNEPDLPVTAVNPTGTPWREVDGVDVDVALWAKIYDYVNADWFEIPPANLRSLRSRDSPIVSFTNQETDGAASLWLSADNNQLFRDETRYLLEIRTTCTRTIGGETRLVGETRSGQRLGIVDTAGPLLVSSDETLNVKTSTLGLPVARYEFNEAIDCSHPALRASIGTKSGVDTVGLVYCTSNGRIVNVVLELDSEEEAEIWSNEVTVVELLGVRDIFGNLFQGLAPSLGLESLDSPTPTSEICVGHWGQCGGSGYSGITNCCDDMRCEASSEWWSSCQRHAALTSNVTIPQIPSSSDGSTAKPYLVSSGEDVQTLTQNQRDKVLPPNMIISSNSVRDGGTSYPTPTPTLPLPPSTSPLPTCVGDRASFDVGYGNCTTYDKSEYCAGDCVDRRDPNTCASAICSECEECVDTTLSPTTQSNLCVTGYIIPSTGLELNRTTFVTVYGGCSIYALDDEYCSTDCVDPRDRNTCADVVCSECGICVDSTLSPTSAPVDNTLSPTPAPVGNLCTGDRETWDGPHGGCSIYALDDEEYCSVDCIDSRDPNTCADAVCSECNVCVDPSSQIHNPFFITPGPTISNPLDSCVKFSELFASGKEMCEDMWEGAYVYQTVENYGYTMWPADDELGWNDALTKKFSNMGFIAGLEDGIVDQCYVDRGFHKNSSQAIDNNLHPSEDPSNFQICQPWSERSCCLSETVDNVAKINERYGPHFRWDRCGSLSEACENFFKREACFYECDTNVGLYRKYPEEGQPHNEFVLGRGNPYRAECDPQALEYNPNEMCESNTWQLEGMPIKASYCDSWWKACKDDFFGTSNGGSFHSTGDLFSSFNPYGLQVVEPTDPSTGPDDDDPEDDDEPVGGGLSVAAVSGVAVAAVFAGLVVVGAALYVWKKRKTGGENDHLQLSTPTENRPRAFV